jgi:hypothetical protein
MASHGYPPTVSGVTLVVQKLARAMVARGHRVTVVTASERGESYEAEDEGVALGARALVGQPLLERGADPLCR